MSRIKPFKGNCFCEVVSGVNFIKNFMGGLQDIVGGRSGRRSAIAAVTLRGLGYKDVKDFGGISRWQGELER